MSPAGRPRSFASRAFGWLQAWAYRRGARRRCFHHDHRAHLSWITSQLIDMGSRKMFWCTRCGKAWIV